MKFIAILTSVPFESDRILSSLRNVRRSRLAGKTVYRGSISSVRALLINTGIGPANAAHSATVIAENFPVKLVIHAGVGGAYPKSGLDIGDIALATKEIFGDSGVTGANGWKGMREIGIPIVHTRRKKYFNEFPLDRKLLKKALNSMKDITIKSGSFVTVCAASGTSKRASELEQRFKAVCENMEGASVAQVCTIYNIPMLEIRGISNISGVRDKRKWNLKLASYIFQDVVLKLISCI